MVPDSGSNTRPIYNISCLHVSCPGRGGQIWSARGVPVELQSSYKFLRGIKGAIKHLVIGIVTIVSEIIIGHMPNQHV